MGFACVAATSSRLVQDVNYPNLVSYSNSQENRFIAQILQRDRVKSVKISYKYTQAPILYLKIWC
ncbi:hypothetical protein I8752_20465 [Nostocaceae cyanobacterium CENA369]|uniref:Uncharacterized protein n=1 Tax=Dendronalium phyllosphericum CENA369 TaxID=1725256 RepID=A0A8J7I6Y2_9NOST|nr:hypothetical protein [Dendronalium phyllosphericum]MBH8575343.1 hypothetical protein [Dendronalium phyllosphericum CENA369]